MKPDPASPSSAKETHLERLGLDQDFTVSKEWLEEIQRRCTDIDSGKATLIDSVTVINEL